MTGIEDIAQKTLRYLRNKGVEPTPMAYFKAFHNVIKQEKIRTDSDLDWCSNWLSKFGPNLQNMLKKAHNPDEFVRILSQEIKDQSQLNEHIKQLRTLCRTLLDSISDVFSISTKTKLHFLFKQGSLNDAEMTGKLAYYWEGFRNSKVHTNSLKKLVNVVAQMLRTPDKNGNVGKEALELSTSLLMHPESLMDTHMIEHIESLLKISNSQTSAQTTSHTDNTNVSTDELSAMGSHIAVFEVNNVRYLESHPTEQVPLDKALEILKVLCLNALKEGSIIGIYDNGFALILNAEPQEIMHRCKAVAQKLQAQKFSYKNALFHFSFDIEVLASKDFITFEALNNTLYEKLSNAQKS